MALGNASTRSLADSWRAFEANASVKLRAIKSARHHREMVSFMNTLVDEIGDDERHALAGLLDVVAALVADYEEQHVEVPDAEPAEVLRELMLAHALRQVDLAGIFGAQSNVSEVLSGKRTINARQARELAERFGVSPAVFI